MPDYSDEVEPLTAREKKWIKRLERALKDCPQRLGVFTIGDNALFFYDHSVSEAYDVEISDAGAERNGIALGSIKSSVQIDGVSG